MKQEIKHKLSGEVIFTAEIECEKNASVNIRRGLAVKVAIKNSADLRSANLRGANLRGADLRGADLSYADLRYADLRSADLRGANLRDANLRDANLRDANLSSADLRDADLRDADLRYADLRGANLRSADLRDADLSFGKVSKGPLEISGSAYYVTLWEGAIQIGCEFHLTKEWNKYTDKEIIKMDGKDALKWWKVWKPILMNIAKKNGMYSINKELNN